MTAAAAGVQMTWDCGARFQLRLWGGGESKGGRKTHQVSTWRCEERLAKG